MDQSNINKMLNGEISTHRMTLLAKEYLFVRQSVLQAGVGMQSLNAVLDVQSGLKNVPLDLHSRKFMKLTLIVVIQVDSSPQPFLQHAKSSDAF